MTTGRRALAAFAAALLTAGLFLPAGPARAHGVYIFAWAEGDQICTESYFSKNDPVRQGHVRFLDPSGRELDSAWTDGRGRLCRPRPAHADDLTLVLDAGQGHRAEFRLGPADLAAETAAAPPSAEAAAPPPAETAAPSPAAAPASADESALRQAVREELQAQLGPLRQALAEALNPPPGPREIIGGLGWLAGLAAFAYWMKRKK